uniref:Uncharacterized protein LOC114345171 n=1 Tax=Diabrotica virgifera virgifera TaxID=50390 RepID=A0A6P7H041_DIAVI
MTALEQSPDSLNVENGETAGTSTQTCLTSEDLNKQQELLSFAEEKLNKLSNRFSKVTLSYNSLKDDNTKCLYYTGLEFPILNILFNKIKQHIPTSSISALEPCEQYLLTLIKLRLNLPFKDLAYRFGISNSTCSSYFNIIISILYQKLKTLIIWPEQEVAQKNIPSCFKEVFQDRTSVIIDCFEVPIEKPSNYLTQQQCWSNYKHHNTIKFLIGMTPQGSISYISNAWGGRTSDKQIVELSGFLDKIKPHDVVLADRGFLIEESLAFLQAKLVIPAFTKGKKQLIPLEIEQTRRIAHLLSGITF